MNKLIRAFATLCTVFSMIVTAQASHYAGGDISYKHLGGDTFEIELTLFYDCGGSSLVPTENRINRVPGSGGFGKARWNGSKIVSSCGKTITTDFDLINPGGTEVSQLCPTALSRCNGGTNPGIEKYIFRDTVVLDPNCNKWTVSFAEFARSGSIQNIINSGGASFYIQAHLDNSKDSTNSSPIFQADPIPYFCTGQQVSYNFGVSDPDGDSISVELSTPQDLQGGTGNPVGTVSNTGSGYSITNPLSNTSFNGSTGTITFNEPSSGKYVVAVTVKDYDANGNVLSEVTRDVLFVGQSCGANTPPEVMAGGLLNTTGRAAKNDSSTVTFMQGKQGCFDVAFTDIGDSIELSTFINNYLPGGTFTTTKDKDTTFATICWTPPATATGSRFVTIFAEDDNCPVSGINSFTVEIIINEKIRNARIEGVLESCPNAGDGKIYATWEEGVGPFGFVWLRTDTVPIDTIVASDTVFNIKAGRTYQVYVVDSADTAFSLSAAFTLSSQSKMQIAASTTTNSGCNPSSCSGEINITSVVNGTPRIPGPTGYSYQWSGISDTTNNPKNLCGGVYRVTVTDENNCDIVDQFSVSTPPIFTSFISDSTDIKCQGDSSGSATVRTDITHCGVVNSPNQCSGTTDYIIGTGTGISGLKNFPTSFSNQNAKHQFLIRKSELDAAGMVEGKVSTIAFQLRNTLSSSFQNFEVNIGCTSKDSITAFQTGLLNVFSTARYDLNSDSVTNLLINGKAWFNIPLDRDFVWDGDSNLVIEVCMNNNTNSSLLNSLTYYTNTSFTSTVYFNSETENACLTDTITRSSKRRPNIKLSWCAPSYTYAWSNGESDSTAVALWKGSHSVTVTNEEGCTSTNSVTIDEPVTPFTASIVSVKDPSCPGASDGEVIVKPSIDTGNTYTWTPAGPTGATDSIRINLGAGNVSVLVDNNGCSVTVDTTLVDPVGMTLDSSVVAVECNGGSTGKGFVTVVGGTSPYTYQWFASGAAIVGETNDSLVDVAAGTYRVVVKDKNLCEDSIDVVIPDAPARNNTLQITQNVQCKGGNDGIAVVVTNGGTQPYSFVNWSQGAKGADDSIRINLSAGVVSVHVVDGNGCRDTLSQTVTEPATALTAVFNNVTDASCAGVSDGTVDINASGGTGAYTFNWNGVGTDPGPDDERIDMPVGRFFVTVTDANNCTFTMDSVISSPDTVKASFTQIDSVRCNGESNGRVYVTPSQGTAPFSYTWFGGGSTGTPDSIRQGLPAGTIRVVVKDANNCPSDTLTATVEEPQVLTANLSTTDVTCAGPNTGTATASATGGNGGYTYAWTPAAVGANLTNLGVNEYTVTVTDSKGCTATATDSVRNAPVIDLSIINTDVKCKGESNGSATVIVNSGGTPPYTFNWSRGPATVNDSINNNLSAGFVGVKVTDNSGCSDSVFIEIKEPANALTAVFNNVSQTSCAGVSDGTVDINASGGTGAYTFNWNGVGTDPGPDDERIDMPVGRFFVTVTDANNCTFTMDSVISSPDTVKASFTQIDSVRCFGESNGRVYVTPSQGTAPFSYTWFGGGSTGTPDSIRQGLPAGTIRVVVKDANNCPSDTLIATVEEPQVLTANLSTTDVTCAGPNTGTATASATGGNGGYTYAWTPAAVGANLTNLGVNEYTVTVTDSKGCTATATDSVRNAPVIDLSIINTDVKCKGESNGSATVIVNSGGTPPYTFNWSRGPATVNDSINNNLSAGFVGVKVTDNSGCSDSVFVEIKEPASALGGSFTVVQNPNCKNASDGRVVYTPTGGRPNYSFAWVGSGTTGVTDSIRENLPKGKIKVIVTDDSLCTYADSVTLTDPVNVLDLVLDFANNPLCKDAENGEVSFSTLHANGAVTYTWNQGTAVGGAVKDTIRTDLDSGLVRIIAQDNFCTDTLEVLLSEPDSLLASITDAIDPGCGANNGRVIVTPNGGTPGYTYTWVGTGAAGVPDSMFINAAAGLVQVTVTDANNCSISLDTTLRAPTPFKVRVDSLRNVLCNGDTTGVVIVSPTGGAKPFTYSWTGAGNGTDSVRTGISVGTVRVTITDANMCTADTVLSITEPAPLGGSFSNVVPVACYGDTTGGVTFNATGGTAPYSSYSWSAGQAGAQPFVRTLLPADTVRVTVTDANGCTFTSDTVIPSNSRMDFNGSSFTNILCKDDSTGQITLSVNGGSTPYNQFSWSDGATTQNRNNIPAATYTVTVEDAQGCEADTTFTLTEPAIELTGIFTDSTSVLCAGGATGSLTITPNGGVAGYSYAWGPGVVQTSVGSDSIAINLLGNTMYTVTITDANNCTAEYSMGLDDPDTLVSSIASTIDPRCANDSTGEARVRVVGGVKPYAYSWPSTVVTGAHDSIATNLAGGFAYVVTVTDNNGCSVTSSVSLTYPSALQAVFTDSTSVSCSNGADGSLTVTPSGGTPGSPIPYVYAWSNGAATGVTDSIAVSLSPNTSYTVTVQDANGCETTLTKSLSNPLPISLSFTDSTSVVCNGGKGSVTVTPSNGTIPYSYVWSPAVVAGSSDSIATQLDGGVTYKVTVSDGNGCTAVDSISLFEPSPMSIQLVRSKKPLCGSNSGELEVIVSGGIPTTAGYVVQWDSNGTAMGSGLQLNNLYAGLYTVQATDSLGCVQSASFALSDSLTLTSISLDSVRNTTCNGVCDGYLGVQVNSTSLPVGLLWNTGATSDTLDSICPGIYTLQVTDGGGCKILFQDTIEEGAGGPSLAFTIKPQSCGAAAVCDGNIVVLPSGGTTPYSFQWATSVTDTSDTLQPVCAAGRYPVTVTDAIGCVSIDSATFTMPTPANFVLTAVDVSCHGSSDGSASVRVTQGGLPARFQWSSGVNDTSDNVSGLSPGTYYVTVTESGGCSKVDTFEIKDQVAITAVIDTSNADCGVANGQVKVTVSGGSGLYQYNWSHKGIDNNATQTNLLAGNYTVTVTDSKNCSEVFGYIIGNVGGPTITVDSKSNASCVGACNGNYFITTTGGTTPYIYNWNSGMASTEDLTGLCKGVYNLQVTDGAGCISNFTDTIFEPDTFKVSTAVVQSISGFGICDGQVSYSITSGAGTGPYQVFWDGVAGGSVANGLCAGQHVLRVVNAAGCEATDTFNLTTPMQIQIDSVDYWLANCGQCNGWLKVTPMGGTPPYRYLWDDGTTADSSYGRCAGVAIVTIFDANNYSETFNIALSSDNGPVTSVSTKNVQCANDCNGEASVAITSGVGPFKYQWTGLTSTSSIATGLCAGEYLVEVEDMFGCVTIDTATIVSPAPMNVSFTTSSPSCNSNNGGIAANISGGTPNTGGAPYGLVWADAANAPLNPLQTTTFANFLSSGIYHLQLTDGNNCKDTFQIALNDRNAPILNLDSANHLDCWNSPCNGELFISVQSTSPLSYMWSNGDTTEDVSGLCAGLHNVEVEDTAGCKAFASYAITANDSIRISFRNVDSATCTSSNDGRVEVMGLGAASMLRYSWTGPEGFVDNRNSIDNLLQGMYAVTVADDKGCSVSDSLRIGVLHDFSIELGNDTTLCEEVSEFTLTADVSVETGFTTYDWYNEFGTPLGRLQSVRVNPENAVNTYIVVVREDVCTLFDTIVVRRGSPIAVEAGEEKQIFIGQSVELGGRPTTTSEAGLEWTPNATLDEPQSSNPMASPSDSTWYFVTATDSNGCFATDSVFVQVFDDITLPDGFTPNGDGVNDTWQLDVLKDYPNAEVLIFSRWGMQVFESKGYAVPWDGTFNGKDVPIGTYYYQVNLNDPSVKTPVLTGPLTIVR